MTEDNPDESHKQHEAVHERIRELHAETHRRVDIIKRQNMIFEFSKQIRKNHPDYKRYYCYHQLISSTPWAETVDGDFEGEDSVEGFFRSMLEKE